MGLYCKVLRCRNWRCSKVDDQHYFAFGEGATYPIAPPDNEFGHSYSSASPVALLLLSRTNPIPVSTHKLILLLDMFFRPILLINTQRSITPSLNTSKTMTARKTTPWRLHNTITTMSAVRHSQQHITMSMSWQRKPYYPRLFYKYPRDGKTITSALI